MLRRVAAAVPVIALGVASATLSHSRPAVADGAECTVPDGWQHVDERNPRYVVFGELHGTEQAPRFLGSLACALLHDGESILVAIEHSARHDPALQAAWHASGESFEAALVGTGWAGRRDGVASEAMFDLVSGLHHLKERGFRIGIVAFNGARDQDQERRLSSLPGQGPHEAAQAENIHDAAVSGNFDRVLVLVGNLHARKDVVDRYGAPFEPMVRRLSQYGEVISLDMSYGEGSAWNCILKPSVVTAPGKSITDEDIDCSARPTRGTADYDRGPFVELRPSSAEGGSEPYDGIFWVGPVSASPPKVDGK